MHRLSWVSWAFMHCWVLVGRVSIGLIMNCLLSRSIKHAFQAMHCPSIGLHSIVLHWAALYQLYRCLVDRIRLHSVLKWPSVAWIIRHLRIHIAFTMHWIHLHLDWASFYRFELDSTCMWSTLHVKHIDMHVGFKSACCSVDIGVHGMDVASKSVQWMMLFGKMCCMFEHLFDTGETPIDVAEWTTR